MPNNAGTLEILGREVALALRPLEQMLQDGSAVTVLAELGVRPPAAVMAAEGLVDALGAAAAAAADLGEPLEQLTAAIAADDLAGIVAAGRALFPKVRLLLDTLPPLGSALHDAAEAADEEELRAALRQLATVLPRRLLDLLVVEYLAARAPGVLGTMELLALADRVAEPGVPGDPFRPPYVRRALHLDRLAALVSDPQRYLREGYGWGAPVFHGHELFRRLEAFLEGIGVEAAAITAPGFPALLEAMFVALRASPDEAPDGIEMRLRFSGSGSVERLFPIGSGGWTLRTASSGEVAGGVRAIIRPPFQAVLRPEGTLRVNATMGVQGGSEASPVLLLGQPGGSRVEARQVSAELGIQAQAAAGGEVAVEPLVRAALAGGAVKVDFSQGDGFIQSLLGAVKLEAGFEAAARWSPRTGLRFEGGAGAEVALPARIELGPVQVQGLTLSLGASSAAPLRVGAAAALSARLGPLRLAVDGVGVVGDVTFPDGGGNLGPANLAVRFRGPRAIGIAFEGGPLSGGGFLSVDEEKGQYAGALQLEFKGIGLKALGLLNTRMPDGSAIVTAGGRPGFSLLVVISGEFTPIQLGYGFTLNAVGGVLGANRTTALDVLRAGVRDRSLDAVLFPRDPVGEAPRLLGVLSRAFPPAPGRFVFGPMARLGWGTPTLLTLDLALLLELPEPVRLAALGRLRMVLPDERAAVVRINMDVVGVVDFGRAEASIDATLYDSQVAGFALSGDMAMRARWGRDAAFALSAGGFHPRFQPPPGFPELRRLAIALSTGNNPRLRLEAYLALTSNTVQFGARLEVRAEAMGFTAEGMLAFDALLQLDPFGFLVELAAMVALRRGRSTLMSVQLQVALSGPRPWHAVGKATFRVLFISGSVRFDVRIGRGDPPAPPLPVDVAKALRDALGDARGWTAQLPPAGLALATFRTLRPAQGELVAHPLGRVGFTQRVAPLGVTLERYGTAGIDGPDCFSVAEVTMGGVPLKVVGEVREMFAPAQFFDLTDDEKLSRPSFEPMQSGRRLAAPTVTAERSSLEMAPLEYEMIVKDDPDRLREPLLGADLARLARAGAAAAAAARAGGARAFEGPALALAVREPEWQLAAAPTSTVRSASAARSLSPASPADASVSDASVSDASVSDASAGSYTEAAERLRATDPDGSRRLRVRRTVGGAA